MDKIGLISTNLAEKLAITVTESPYRVTADIISSTCGQSISAGGVWNVMQRLGERISEEEEYAVKQMEADQTAGEREIPVLETQNCTVITLRIKHRRMRWSVRAANNLAKVLYRKENKELAETIDRYTDGLFFTIQMK